jgi:hypothetical protein
LQDGTAALHALFIAGLVWNASDCHVNGCKMQQAPCSFETAQEGLHCIRRQAARRMKSVETGLARNLDVGGLLALGALHYLKGNLLAFLKGLEAIHVDGGKMCEQIPGSVIGRDETETFCIVEPFDYTSCHFLFPSLKKRVPPQNDPAIPIRNFSYSTHLFQATAVATAAPGD